MLALAGCDPQENEKDPSETDEQTKLRRLVKTDLMLSPVGFGAQRTKDAELIRYALDQGINHIETWWLCASGRPDSSCVCIGKAIAGKRDSVCLAAAYLAGARPGSESGPAHQFEETVGHSYSCAPHPRAKQDQPG